MELTLSTHLLVYRPLPAGGLPALSEAGFSRLEIWLAEPHVPWRDAKRLTRFRRALDDAGLAASSVHLPFYPSVPELLEHGRRWSLIDPDPAARRTARDAAAEGLHAAAALGASQAVLHLGWQRDAWPADAAVWAREAVAALLPVARACNVALLLENIISEGTRCRRLVELLDEVDPQREAGICLDLGHAHVEGDVLEELEDALPRLRHLHVHDNDGRSDDHLAPGLGTMPWDAVQRRLATAGYCGQGALEIRDRSRGGQAETTILRQELPGLAEFRALWNRPGMQPC